MVTMGGASGVVTGRCALVDARAPIAVDPTVAFFPRGAVRRTARGRKSAREKSRTDPFWDRARSFPTTPLERPFSSNHRPSIGPLRAVTTKPPRTAPPDHENGGARSAWKKRTTTPRSGRTPLRARHGRRSPRVRHSRSPHVSPLRDPARARHRRRVRPPSRARRRLSNAVVIGGVSLVHGLFKPRRGAARARPRREGAGIVTIGRD